MRPGFGEANWGAMGGAVVGAIGGLFALGVPHAIAGHNVALLVGTPVLSLVSCVIAGLIGWLIGGQTGPRLAQVFHTQRSEIIGGGLGGLIPVLLIALWGWYMVAGR